MQRPDEEPIDSLDAVELAMAVEELLIQEALIDPSLAADERDRSIQEIVDGIRRGEFGDDWDDDGFAALVRKLAPRGPLGRSGAQAEPEE
jgi:hypothetical protein